MAICYEKCVSKKDANESSSTSYDEPISPFDDKGSSGCILCNKNTCECCKKFKTQVTGVTNFNCSPYDNELVTIEVTPQLGDTSVEKHLLTLDVAQGKEKETLRTSAGAWDGTKWTWNINYAGNGGHYWQESAARVSGFGPKKLVEKGQQ